ncbi:hypothetical protein B0H13DRAFT_2666111 [Mycena leptocephala]|nr:hypothetical protein B0H13DRAFT_2666111 [Mycena leptocephala]
MSTPRTLRSRLAAIDDEMTELRARLRRLDAERRPIVDALRSVVYPVLTLPTEVVAEVFLQYVDSAQIGADDPNIPHAPGWIEPCGPLLLASVCRAWREIALALRPLWSCFRVCTSPNAIPTTQKLLECWLPRSGGHPLDIRLYCPSDVQDIISTALAPSFHQIRAFSCSVDIPTTFPSDLFRGRMQGLRKLQISLDTWPEDLNGTPASVTAFADAPELRELTLVNFPESSITLPWAQLTYLELSGQTTAQCVEILHHTPDLETLRVDLIESPDMPPTFVRLTRLHTLQFDKYQSTSDLLDYITLPALAHVELSLLEPSMSPRVISPRFVALVARSACALRSIALDNADVPSAIQCLRAVPTASVVRLTDLEWDVYSFRHLFRALAEPEFLPNIRSLALNPCLRTMEIPYVELTTLLASRWEGRGNGAARLESFELVLAPTAGFDRSLAVVSEVQRGLDALRALADDGLKINIRSLQKITDDVDAIAVCPPVNRTTI